MLSYTQTKDSHAHILEYGASKLIPLEDGRNIKGENYISVGAVAHPCLEVVKSVGDYILANPDLYNNKSKIVEGWGWDHTIWPEGRWPNAVCPLLRYSCHLNNVTLRMISNKILSFKVAPSFFRVRTDTVSGSPRLL